MITAGLFVELFNKVATAPLALVFALVAAFGGVRRREQRDRLTHLNSELANLKNDHLHLNTELALKKQKLNNVNMVVRKFRRDNE
jgi:hypothetical protein